MFFCKKGKKEPSGKQSEMDETLSTFMAHRANRSERLGAMHVVDDSVGVKAEQELIKLLKPIKDMDVRIYVAFFDDGNVADTKRGALIFTKGLAHVYCPNATLGVPDSSGLDVSGRLLGLLGRAHDLDKVNCLAVRQREAHYAGKYLVIA